MDVSDYRNESVNEAASTGVGATLAGMRQRMGLTREDVASALRIRIPYLKAMEEGRFHDLPGAAYASGFVRGYAEYLGMDGNEMVRRFKMESGARFRTDQSLNMPSVPTEERIPGGAIIFIVLILAVAGYVGWQYSISEDKSMVEMIESIPTKVMEFVSDVVNPSETGTGQETDGGASSSSPSSSVSPSSTSISPSQSTAGTDSSLQTSSAVTTSTTQENTPALVSGGLTTTPSSNQASPVTTAGASSTHSSEPAVVSSPDAQTPPAEKPALPATASTSGVNSPSQPEVTFGGENTGGRVVVRATTGRAWMRVSDGGKIIFERTLNPGESYLVPNKTGLKLRTGNALATEIMVDGKPVGSLGTAATRRDIALDPDALLALNP